MCSLFGGGHSGAGVSQRDLHSTSHPVRLLECTKRNNAHCMNLNPSAYLKKIKYNTDKKVGKIF